jgi:hypothetical protein
MHFMEIMVLSMAGESLSLRPELCQVLHTPPKRLRPQALLQDQAGCLCKSQYSFSVSGEQPLNSAEQRCLLVNKRVGEHLEQSTAKRPRPRQGRTCRKCGIQSCSGKKEIKKCIHKCRHCGKNGQDLSCKGRNVRANGKTCSEEWDDK